MGELIKCPLIERNVFRADAELSANLAAEYIEVLEQGENPDTSVKIDRNKFTALTNYVGLFVNVSGRDQTTSLAGVYLDLYRQNKIDAWRWLATRTLWRFVVPNGILRTNLNREARSKSISFALFPKILGVLIHLDAHRGDRRFLYYEELCQLLDNDDNWALNADELYTRVLGLRRTTFPSRESRRALLDDLEPEYGIGRDNYNGVFNNLLNQTGLFDYCINANGKVGLAISSTLDKVMRRRIRFILDHPPDWDPERETWPQFLELHSPDLPQEVSLEPTERVEEETASIPIDDIVEAMLAACEKSGLAVPEPLVRRFVASLLAKPFLILTGLSGSGKTKLAQLFAAWITPRASRHTDPFVAGSVVEDNEATYYVRAADTLAVEFQNSDDEETATKVALPRALIREWADSIESNGYTRETSSETIEQAIFGTTPYSGQLNSFHSQLKAAAFALLEARRTTTEDPCYEVVAVGADWTSTEHVLGYADVLDPSQYATTQTLSLIMRAHDNPKLPYFLILDEMNLSHVERYFADLLSAMESDEPVHLHNDKDRYNNPAPRAGVPPQLKLPKNLFVVGTVNVDETTYMFSPKVLDRANVIEFRADETQMETYLKEPTDIELDAIAGTGISFAESLVAEALAETDPDEIDRQRLEAELMLFFRVLSRYDAEFAYRSAREITRFVSSYGRISIGEAWDFRNAFDAQIVQKLLPKLHGSRSRLEPILCALALLCAREHEWEDPDTNPVLKNRDDLRDFAVRAASLTDDDLHPLTPTGELNPQYSGGEDPYYRLSFDKIRRMLHLLQRNGFASFAEA